MAFTGVNLHLCVGYVGLGSMPSAMAMRQIRASSAGLMANMLPQANVGLNTVTQGVVCGGGPTASTCQGSYEFQRGDLVDMPELLPEFWSLPQSKDQAKTKAKIRWARKVQDIFTWLQCFALYMSIRAPEMFELLMSVRQLHCHMRLNTAFRSDLLWWATLLETWNGVAMMRHQGLKQACHHVWTDTSRQFGCGPCTQHPSHSYNSCGPAHQDQRPSSCSMRAFCSRNCSPLF